MESYLVALEYSLQVISQKRWEREEGLWSVKWKKARSEGKKAFIRFSDGELIVNGKPHKVAAEGELFSPGLSPGTGETSHQD